MNEEQYFGQMDPAFLDTPPELPPLPQLQGEKIVLEELSEILKAGAEAVADTFIRVVGVKFGAFGRVHSYDARNARLKRGDGVVCEVPDKGIMYGEVVQAPVWLDNTEAKLRLRPIERAATAEDQERHQRALTMAQNGLERAKAQTSRMTLAMDILELEYTLDLRKAILYFASEDRVDFRGLLKELTHDLKAKVELRQVGARDQTKLVGGIGPCGEELCCTKHLNRFHGVNIRMAKDQGLSLKPTRVSGMCGRLKCCLQYEVDVYKKLSKGLPAPGNKVKCSKGCGVVSEVDVLRQLVTVVLEDGQVAKMDVTEVVRKDGKGFKNEKVVATTDVDALVNQMGGADESIEEGDGLLD